MRAPRNNQVPGERRTLPPIVRMGDKHRYQPLGAQKIPIKRVTRAVGAELGVIAHPAPGEIAARDVCGGMVVSEIPSARNPRPRKIVVRTIGYADDVLRPQGEAIRVRRIFFNGNARKKYNFGELLLLHFDPAAAPDGMRSDVREYTEHGTTPEEKEQAAQRRAQQRETLQRIAGLPDAPAPVEALLDLSNAERPGTPEHVSEFAPYDPDPKPRQPWRASTQRVVLSVQMYRALTQDQPVILPTAPTPRVRISVPLPPLPKFDPDRVQDGKPVQHKVPPGVRYTYDAHVKAYRAYLEAQRKQAQLAAIVAKYGK